jgi:amino acid transporter
MAGQRTKKSEPNDSPKPSAVGAGGSAARPTSRSFVRQRDEAMKIPQKIAAMASLLAWFVPFVPLVFIFPGEPRPLNILRGFLALPFLSGVTPAVFYGRLFHQQHTSEWLGLLLGLALPIGFAFLISRGSRWQANFFAVGMITATAMSWFTYRLLLL